MVTTQTLKILTEKHSSCVEKQLPDAGHQDILISDTWTCDAHGPLDFRWQELRERRAVLIKLGVEFLYHTLYQMFWELATGWSCNECMYFCSSVSSSSWPRIWTLSVSESRDYSFWKFLDTNLLIKCCQSFWFDHFSGMAHSDWLICIFWLYGQNSNSKLE